MLTTVVDDWATSPADVACALSRALADVDWAPTAVGPLLADAKATAALTAALRRGLSVEVTGGGWGGGGAAGMGCVATAWSDLSDVTGSTGQGGGSVGGGGGTGGGRNRHGDRRGCGSAEWRQYQTLPPLPAAVKPTPEGSASYMSGLSIPETVAAAGAAAQPWANAHVAGSMNGDVLRRPPAPSSPRTKLATATAVHVPPTTPTPPPPPPLRSLPSWSEAGSRL